MFSCTTTSGETNLKSELDRVLLIISKISPFLIYDVSMCVLWHIRELKRIWMGLRSTKNCRLLQPSHIRETSSIFTPAVFLINLRFPAHFPKIGNIRVAPPTLAVLHHTWWSQWQCGELDRDLWQTGKLVHSGHHGYRLQRLDERNTMVLK